MAAIPRSVQGSSAADVSNVKEKPFTVIQFRQDKRILGFLKEDFEEIPTNWVFGDTESQDYRILFPDTNKLKKSFDLAKFKEKCSMTTEKTAFEGIQYIELKPEEVKIICTARTRLSAVRKIQNKLDKNQSMLETTEDERPRHKVRSVRLNEFVQEKSGTKKRKRSDEESAESPTSILRTESPLPTASGAQLEAGHGTADFEVISQTSGSNADVGAPKTIANYEVICRKLNKVEELLRSQSVTLGVLVKDSADKNVATRSLQRCSDKIIQILAKSMQGNPTVFIKRADLAEAGINLPLVDLNGLHELSDKLELDKTADKLLAEYVLRNLSGSTVRQVCTAALRECLKEGLMSRLVLKHKKKNKRKNTVVKTVFKAFKVYETLRDAVLSYCTSNSITCTPKCVDQGFSYRLTKEGSAALAVEDSESEQETNESNNVQQQRSVQVGELSARSAHPIAQYQEAIDSGEDVDMMYKQATAQNTHDSSFDSE